MLSRLRRRGPRPCGSAIRNDVGGDGLGALRDEIRHRYVGAFGSEYPRGGAAHAAGCAGDENGQSRDERLSCFKIRHRMLAEWGGAWQGRQRLASIS